MTIVNRQTVTSFFAGAVMLAAASGSAAAADCNGKTDALGVGRTVQIDTTGGPGFGFQHYKSYDFLQPKEVVLTFDDGPLPNTTRTILKALADECVLATFFPVGKLIAGYSEVLKEVAAGGHTVGGHTWSHQDLRKMTKKKLDDAKGEIERGLSATRLAIGDKASPFFRFPYLQDSAELIAYLGERNISMFSTDIDSFDFKRPKPDRLVRNVMDKLEKSGKGILLFHDIQPNTAKALPDLLVQLREKGYKIVHLTSKAPLTTLPEVDAAVQPSFKGSLANAGGKPLSSVVTTVTTQ